MAAPEIPELPSAPQPNDSPVIFNAKAFTWVEALTGWTTAINSLVEWMNGNVGKYPLAANATTSYDIVDADTGKYIRFTATSGKSVTISTDATTGKTNGYVWNFRNAAVGNLTITPAGGVTVNAPAGGSLLIAPNATASLVKVAADTYDLIGQTIAP